MRLLPAVGIAVGILTILACGGSGTNIGNDVLQSRDVDMVDSLGNKLTMAPAKGSPPAVITAAIVFKPGVAVDETTVQIWAVDNASKIVPGTPVLMDQAIGNPNAFTQAFGLPENNDRFKKIYRVLITGKDLAGNPLAFESASGTFDQAPSF